jgi:DNA-binding LacI/PurR family transcriptional regulator
MSIADIANMTDVSIATVSRYINGSGKVADETAKRIEEAMQQTGYRPSIRRPGRKTENRQGIRTGVITFLSIGKIDVHQMHKEPVFPMMLAGLQGYLIEHGLMVIYAHSQGGDDIPEALDSRFCDGVIVYGRECQLGPRLISRLKSLPTVWCFTPPMEKGSRGFAQVSYNNQMVGPLAAEYLHEKGHRQVAFFNSMAGYEIFDARQSAFVQRCHELGMKACCLEEPVAQIISRSAVKLLDAYLAQSMRCTGMAFTTDHSMLAIYNEMRVKGLDVAGLGLVGCNNERQFLSHFLHAPASIDIQLEHMGSRAAQLVLNMINNQSPRTIQRVSLEPLLIPEVLGSD